MEQNATTMYPPPLPRQSRPGQRTKTWVWVGVILAALATGALIAHSFQSWVSSTFLASTFEEGGIDEFPALMETWSYGKGGTKVARIDISGVIIQGREDSIFSMSRDPVDTALRMIRTASQDEDVKALIVVIDSPGGGVTASDIIHHELQEFKRSAPDRKIVVLFGDVAASGGYYVATVADAIVAHPTTITGSIGVLISTMNFKGFGDRYGIKSVSITSGRNKDMLNPFKDLTEEQEQLLQVTIDDIYQRFVKVVSEGRAMPEEEVRRLADGRIFTATEALRLKLIDQIGYWNDAMAETARQLKVKDIKVIRYEEPFTWSAFFEAVQKVNLSLRSLRDPGARMYLWSW